ncbi:MAG TPA: urea ABC transporter permease subunit UrtB, partial [Lacunisphaera sp.]|nr:urea ABC transporter permease subunit UrtB [Lacunisphaera sp.]
MNYFQRFVLIFTLTLSLAAGADSPRTVIARAILTEDAAAQRELISSLAGQGDEVIPGLLAGWRTDAIFLYRTGTATIPVQLTGEKDAAGAQTAVRVDDGAVLKDEAGQPLRVIGGNFKTADHTSALRRAMKAVLDLVDLASPNQVKRLQAVQTIGQAQDAAKIAALEARLPVESDARVSRALREAIALIKLKDPSDTVKVAALVELEKLHTLSSTDFLKKALQEAKEKKSGSVAAAAAAALHAVETHRSFVDLFGTIFRGISLGSILLVLALGLAITFGLMGVINMAHGEMIAVGAYTTYLVQNIFGTGIVIPFFGLSLGIPGMNLDGWAYQCYFIAAIPLSFLMAALVGIGLERSIIQWLYRRPLESLLATWGVSVVLQQIFKLMFGSNNVQVSSPVYLSGNWTPSDIILGWNRVFVIGFALVIVFGVWLVLTRTSLGLLIRAVMQNRGMASCMGVRTERVNMLTFGLGSGLAGLAGTFLSQIGNVGPSMGQNYIVDCFMTVVVGGVGSLPGTVIAAFGIGLADQSLQQILLDPVIGKIVVLL